MSEIKNIDEIIEMYNNNEEKHKEREKLKEAEAIVQAHKDASPSLISKFRKNKSAQTWLAIILAAVAVGTVAGLVVNEIKENDSYNPSKYYPDHKKIVKAIEMPDTTTLEFLTEQGYNLSQRDEEFLKDPKMNSYLNKIHDDIGPDNEQVENIYGDVVNLLLEGVKSYLRSETGLSEDTKIGIDYKTKGSLEKDEIRITYYGHPEGNPTPDEGIILPSDATKSVIQRIVAAQNFAMEKGEGEVGNTQVLNDAIAGLLELDDQNPEALSAIKAIDKQFKETHK